MNLRLPVFALASLCLALPSCKEKAQSAAAASSAPSGAAVAATPPEISAPLVGTWPPTGTETVTGYRLGATPGGEGTWSLLTGDNQVDLATLKRVTVAPAQLTPEQNKKLLGCIFGDWERSGPAACYDPHHIFLFRDASGKVTHAIEICFGCDNVHSSPEFEEKYWNHHDLRGLARLCDEIGIGMTHGTAEDYIRLQDENDRLSDEAGKAADESEDAGEE